MIKLEQPCPICDCRAVLEKELREISYRGEAYPVTAHFYTCDGCGESFTTTALDRLTLGQVHDRYRTKHRIPFPEDMVRIREKYGLSARKMSDVLGLGINGYSNYEKGEMPSQAIGNLIATAEDPAVFHKMAENARQLLTASQWKKLDHRIAELVRSDLEAPDQDLVSARKNYPDEYTGYRLPDLSRIASLVIFFLKNASSSYNDRLKLNKLLFYADFAHFKYHGRSITGLSYRAIPYGPVPSSYDRLFSWLQQKDLIQINWDHVDQGAGRERFTSMREPDGTIFSEDELASMDAVLEEFGAMPSWDLVNISHQEKAWLELAASREMISYPDYAFDLKAL